MPTSPSRGRDAALAHLAVARSRSLLCALVTFALSIAASTADGAGSSLIAFALLPLCLLGLALTLAYMHRVNHHQTVLGRMSRQTHAEASRHGAQRRDTTS